MISKIEGFIIKETPYGETSKIIHVLTKEGIIGMMAKGAKQVKSKLRSTTLKYTYGVFNVYYKKDKLSTLISVDVVNHLKNCRSDIVLISYVAYLTDLVEQVLKQFESPDIYDDFINSILKIEDGLDPLIITNIMEVKMLDYLGVGLNLTCCNTCGSKKGIVTLSTERGGLICTNCYKGERLLPLEMVKILNMYYLVDIKSISKLKIKDNLKNEINIFLSSYYDDFTGLYLKSKDFLKQIKDM